MAERKKPGDKKYINLIYLPDFSEYLTTDASDPSILKDFGRLLSLTEAHVLVRQMGLAIKAWILNEVPDVNDFETAEKRHKQIVTPQIVSRQVVETTLMGLLYQLSGDIMARGLCNVTELDIMIHWIEENGKHTAICAETLAGLMKRPDTDYALKRSTIIEAALGSRLVLSTLLEMTAKGTLQLHEEITRAQLIMEEGGVIGQGTVGTVSIAKWKGTRVAVKGFASADEKAGKEFGREIGLLSLVQHHNIVVCFGASTNPKDLFIVEELLLGNLYEILHDVNLPINQTMKLNFTSGVAAGMRHLHRCHLIHRDLKSLNVLVGTNFEVKICDFGLSRFCDKSSGATMTNNIGTVCWVAPEIFARKPYNEKADVYSFAIVFWEILTRKQPFGHSSAFSVPMLVLKGERPSIPKEVPRDWARLIQKCWAKKPLVRPSFEEICLNIKNFKIDLATHQHSKEKSDSALPKTLVKEGNQFFIYQNDQKQIATQPLGASDSGGSLTTKTGSWSDPTAHYSQSSGNSSSQDSPGPLVAIRNLTNPNRSDSWSDSLLIIAETPRESLPSPTRGRSSTLDSDEPPPLSLSVPTPPVPQPTPENNGPSTPSTNKLEQVLGVPSSELPLTQSSGTIKKRSVYKVSGKNTESAEDSGSGSKTFSRKRLGRHASTDLSSSKSTLQFENLLPKRKESGSKPNLGRKKLTEKAASQDTEADRK